MDFKLWLRCIRLSCEKCPSIVQVLGVGNAVNLLYRNGIEGEDNLHFATLFSAFAKIILPYEKIFVFLQSLSRVRKRLQEKHCDKVPFIEFRHNSKLGE